MKNKDYQLWRACENGEVEAVRECLKLGSDPNAQHPGVFKWTAMHLAAINDEAPTLELLHDHGAQLDLRDASGRTPIRLARKHLKLNAVTALEAMMGYQAGEGSDTEVELGDDLPPDIQERLGLNSTEDLPQDYKHSFWRDLQDTLNNSTTLGKSEDQAEEMIQNIVETEKELEMKLKQKEANRIASDKRRDAACEYKEQEKTDAEGFTPSQRRHLNRLIHASKVNAETGIPMEHILGNEKYKPPPGGYDLPPRKRDGEEGPDKEDNGQGAETGEGYFENAPFDPENPPFPTEDDLP